MTISPQDIRRAQVAALAAADYRDRAIAHQLGITLEAAQRHLADAEHALEPRVIARRINNARHEPAPHDWRTDGACRGEDPETWFPNATDVKGTEAARAVCALLCPVMEICGNWALDNPAIDHGVFGGLTEDERDRVRRNRVRAATLAGRSP